MCDVLWSDPDDRDGWNIVVKGAGYTFGWRITQEFLLLNQFKNIIRSHTLISGVRRP